MASFFKQAYNKVADNVYNNPSSMYPIQAQSPTPKKNTMIQRIKNTIITLMPPSNMRNETEKYFDMLDVTLQINEANDNGNNSTTIQQITSLLNEIVTYIQQRVAELQLTGMVKKFFDSLADWILLYVVLFGAGGSFNRGKSQGYGGKLKRTNKRRRHKNTRRH
jgi:hypothetical protein